MEDGKDHYTWDEFDQDLDELVKCIRAKNRAFNGVYGPPRGGLAMAVAISHAMNLPFLAVPHDSDTLIVDDIADKGHTLQKYAGKNVIATIFYHPDCIFEPTIWLRKKGDRWIEYPWEKKRYNAFSPISSNFLY